MSTVEFLVVLYFLLVAARCWRCTWSSGAGARVRDGLPTNRTLRCATSGDSGDTNAGTESKAAG
jgi:hypothetical protein